MRYEYQNPQMRGEFREEPLKGLLERRGMVTFLAKGLGVSKAAVAQWPRIPEHHIPAVSRLLDIPQYQLRDHRSKPKRGE